MDSDDLRVGVAIARNEFDLVPLTEAVLADALRHLAKELAYPQLLHALADALDNPSAPTRLKLVQERRGTPGSSIPMGAILGLARVVRQRVEAGEKQEAVIADVCREWGVSRSSVMKYLKKGRSLLPLVDELRELKEALDKERDLNSSSA
jgi:hypothetical protein